MKLNTRELLIILLLFFVFVLFAHIPVKAAVLPIPCPN